MTRALALWAAAAALALLAQRQLASSEALGVLLFCVAALLAIIGSRLAAPNGDHLVGQPFAGRGVGPKLWVSCLLLAAAAAAFEWQRTYNLSYAAWLASLIVAIIATWPRAATSAREIAGLPVDATPSNGALGTWRAKPLRRGLCILQGAVYQRELHLLLAILAVSAALRLPDLAGIPADVHGDEAAVGLGARHILHGDVANLFGVGWGASPFFSFLPSAASMLVFGDNLYGLRLASVVQGLAAVLFTYLLAKELFGLRVAAVACALLAVSQWDIHFSRSGLGNIQAQLAQVLLFYLLVRASRRGRAFDFLLVGLAAGWAANIYVGARLVLVLAVLYVVYRCLNERGFLEQRLAGFASAGFGFALFLAPVAAFYVQQPGALTARAQDVFLLAAGSLQHAYATYHTQSFVEVMRLQVERSLLAFNLFGETSVQYGHRGPLLDFWTAALFVPGLAIASSRLRDSRYFLLAIWFWLTLLMGSILTTDALFSPRVITIVPVLCLFAAVFVETGWCSLGAIPNRWLRRAFGAGALALVLAATMANYHDYFVTHVQRHAPAGFYTELSGYISSVNDRYRVYLIGAADTTLGYDTPRFLLPGIDGVDARDLPLPLQLAPESKGVAFLVAATTPDALARLSAIEAVYPRGELLLHKGAFDVPLFYSYLVD